MQETDKEPHEFRDGDKLGVLAVQTAEIKLETISIPEISAARAATYEDLDSNKVYLFECGDDRGITDDSADKLAEDLGVEKYAMFRYFGGPHGITRVLAVTVAVQYGADALQVYGADFNQLTSETINRIEKTSKVKFAAHSADGSEGNSTELNQASTEKLGCAYCASLGAVCGLCQPDSPLVALALREQNAMFGDNSLVAPVAAGNAAFEQHFFAAEGKSFAITRKNLADGNIPTVILAGKHKNAADVIVAENFNSNKVSNPNRAIDAGVPFYNNDVTIAAELLIKAYPELKLSPTILLSVMDHDIRAVRAALADHEGLGAEDMALERQGDPKAAIAYLESLVLAA